MTPKEKELFDLVGKLLGHLDQYYFNDVIKNLQEDYISCDGCFEKTDMEIMVAAKKEYDFWNKLTEQSANTVYNKDPVTNPCGEIPL